MLWTTIFIILAVLGWGAAAALFVTSCAKSARAEELAQENSAMHTLVGSADAQRAEALREIEKLTSVLTIEREHVKSLKAKLAAAYEKAATVSLFQARRAA